MNRRSEPEDIRSAVARDESMTDSEVSTMRRDGTDRQVPDASWEHHWHLASHLTEES